MTWFGESTPPTWRETDYEELDQETGVSRHNRGPVEGPLKTPQNHSVVIPEESHGGPQLGPYDAERRQSVA